MNALYVLLGRDGWERGALTLGLALGARLSAGRRGTGVAASAG
jgi:hypothetical protein